MLDVVVGAVDVDLATLYLIGDVAYGYLVCRDGVLATRRYPRERILCVILLADKCPPVCSVTTSYVDGELALRTVEALVVLD